MRKLLCAALFLVSTAAVAQSVPSDYVPLNPCRLYDSRTGNDPLGAGDTRYLLARGACNVPREANGVALTLTVVAPASAGYGLAWGSESLRPTAATLTFPALVTTSGHTVARLCYPAEECSGEDLAVFVSQASNIVVDVTGYTVPVD